MDSLIEPNILLVDDYEVNLELLELYLQSFVPKANLIKAETGLEAMQYFWENELDLVLMDVMLPDTSGFELCHMMKEIRGENLLPIVMITALDDKRSLLQGLSSGADDFLTKPVNKDELSIRVRNLLRLRATTIDLKRRYNQISQEMELARSILLNLLPQKLPQIEGVYTEVIYEPARMIGGDFFDVFPVGDSHYGVFIADVKGHGAASAMLIAMLKEQIVQAEDAKMLPSQFFQRINENICIFFQEALNDYFITAFYLLYNIKTGEITWANAGHNPPVYFSEGDMRLLDEPGGVPFGIIKEVDYVEGSLYTENHSGLFLYTDGIFEQSLFYMPPRTFDDIQGVLDMLAISGVTPTVSLLMREIRLNIGYGENADDVNAIGMEFERG